METTVKQLYVGYQTHSLIEFMIGDGARPGWLDKQSRSQSSSANCWQHREEMEGV